MELKTCIDRIFDGCCQVYQGYENKVETRARGSCFYVPYVSKKKMFVCVFLFFFELWSQTTMATLFSRTAQSLSHTGSKYLRV